MIGETKPAQLASQIALVAAFLVSGTAVKAQETPAPTAASTGFEASADIVVTAQRREQSLQDVPMAVTAFSGERLTQLGVTTATDVAKFTPGVNAAGVQGGTLLTFSIRGLTMGDFNPHQEGPIAVYRDDVYISSLQGQGFANFDIQRVEILKGPQGTTFGRNATGGLANFISRQPSDEFTGNFDARYGSFDHRRVEAGVGGPIAEGLTFRAAGLYDQYAPYLRNLAPGRPNGFWNKTFAGRLQLQYQPSPDWRILLAGQIGRTDLPITGADQRTASIAIFENGILVDTRELGPTETCMTINDGVCTGTRPVPGGNFFGYRDPDGPGRLTSDSIIGGPTSFFFHQNLDHNYSDSESGTATISHNLSDALTVTSLTDYTHFKWRLAADVISGPTPIAAFDTYTDGIRQFSQELRVNGDYENINFVAGLYYINIKSENGGIFGFLGGRDQIATNSHHTKSYSAFAQADWKFAPDFTLTGGFRFIHETKTFSFLNRVFAIPSGAVTVLRVFDPSTSPLANSEDNLWAARLGISYEPTRDILLYATFNRGVKAGGYNQSLNPATPDEGFLFKPERLHSFEAGAKTSWADGRVVANVSGFYYDYKDYQAFQAFGPGINLLINADARVYGGEAELALRPAGGLNFNLSAAYTNALVHNVNTSPGRGVDRRPAFSPLWQLVALSRYEFPLFSDFRLALQGDVTYRSSYFTQIANTTLVRQKGYALADVQASLITPARWQINFAVRNLTDKIYRLSGFENSAGFGHGPRSFVRGREFEVGVRIEW
jgi:iron complex outermembrane receptor protein